MAMKKDSVKDKGGLIFSVSKVQHDSYGITSMPLPKKHFSQLYFSNGEIDIIKKHLDRFKETQEMYASKQLPYKTGILLYGEPGTGKTSLVKAIATEYGRSIATITVSRIDDIDFTELATLFDNDTVDTYIVLFEDIDTINNALSSREDKVKVDNDDPESPERPKKKTRGDVMNALMQFLDGVNSPNNVIFIATTNYINELDSAFTRTGRFDLKLEVDEITKKDVTRFIETFDLPASITDEIIDIYVEKKKQEFIDKKIKAMEEEKSTDKKKFHFSKEERQKITEEMDMSEFDPNFTRFNQSLMQNIIMSKINKSDKIESVVDSAEVIIEKHDKEDDEDDEY
jgi:SpoVK/Ycf46/Vps4 family AAA+-type ATPase